jgi:hypothetical protein
MVRPYWTVNNPIFGLHFLFCRAQAMFEAPLSLGKHAELKSKLLLMDSEVVST